MEARHAIAGIVYTKKKAFLRSPEVNPVFCVEWHYLNF